MKPITGKVGFLVTLGFILGAGWLEGPTGFSQGVGNLAPKAYWSKSHNTLELIVPLTGLLTSKQRSMIQGGFTTISEFAIIDKNKEQDTAIETILWTLSCTVKFDAWDDTYEVIKLPIDEEPQHESSVVSKNFDDYGALCLTARMPITPRLLMISQGGEPLIGRLSVHQTSVEEGQRIKDWLVKQQSGVMQSLFKHMLGELSIHQTLGVKIAVPPPPLEPVHPLLKSTPPTPKMQGI